MERWEALLALGAIVTRIPPKSVADEGDEIRKLVGYVAGTENIDFSKSPLKIVKKGSMHKVEKYI